MTPVAAPLPPAEKLLTAEEYARLPEDGRFTELVRGRIVELSRPQFPHGLFCSNVDFFLRLFLMNHDLGWVTINDTGIVTERGPDTVRGADVAFHSYTRIPKGQRPEGYPEVAPDLVFEGRSPTDRWRDLSEKAYEYLAAGVTIVCILDPAHRTITVLRDEQPPLTLLPDADLTFPDLLPGFAVRVERFFA